MRLDLGARREGAGSLQGFGWEASPGRRCWRAGGCGEAGAGRRWVAGEPVQMAEGRGGGPAEAAEFPGEWRGGRAGDRVGGGTLACGGVGVGCAGVCVAGWGESGAGPAPAAPGSGAGQPSPAAPSAGAGASVRGGARARAGRRLPSKKVLAAPPAPPRPV